jgi:hypothetical protein
MKNIGQTAILLECGEMQLTLYCDDKAIIQNKDRK